jgi:hypothetical protein
MVGVFFYASFVPYAELQFGLAAGQGSALLNPASGHRQLIIRNKQNPHLIT